MNKKLWAIYNGNDWIYVLASSFDKAVKAAREIDQKYSGGMIVENFITPDIIAD
jgi:hypothetical protein